MTDRKVLNRIARACVALEVEGYLTDKDRAAKVDDGQRTINAIKGADNKRLLYKE